MSEEDSIMKKIAVFTFAPLLALAVAATSSLAFAQTSGTGASGGVTSPNRQTQPGSMAVQAQPPMAPLAGASSGTQLSIEQGQPDISDRKGNDQRDMELVQTSLLNRFGGMGFAEMRNFRKIGANYAAEVRTVEGVWMNILVDPATGAVTVQQ
jgi:hypothetical protein